MKAAMTREFADIEHRFDPDFYRTTVKNVAYGYIDKAFDSKGVVSRGLENLDDIPSDASIIYAALHKCHLDYVLIPYVLAKDDKRAPLIAAGDNLFLKFWKFDSDTCIRKSGAYKVIRDPPAEQQLAVVRQLTKYTTQLLENGNHILEFPEGGRSYTGETNSFVPAAIGVVTTAARRAGRRLAFVPTAVTYERVPEDRFFRCFAQYKKSRGLLNKIRYYASDWPMIFLQKKFDHPLGKALVRFGKPIIHEPETIFHSAERDSLAERLQKECNDLVEVTPTALVSHALQNTHECEIADTIDSLNIAHSHCKERGAHMTGIENEYMSGIIVQALRFLDAPFRRFIVRKGSRLIVRRPDILQYYANTIKHFFE